MRSLEDRIRILRQVILDLGGTPPTDKEAEAIALQIEAQIIKQSQEKLQ